MQRCLITFASQTTAQRFKKIAYNNGYSVKIIQTPKEISYGGCSYAAYCSRNDVSALMDLCQRNSVSCRKLFAEFFDISGKKYYEEIM